MILWLICSWSATPTRSHRLPTAPTSTNDRSPRRATDRQTPSSRFLVRAELRAWCPARTGETLADLTTHARSTVHDLILWVPPATTILAATHGTWLARALLALGIPIDCSFWLSMQMPAIYTLSFDGRDLRTALGPGLENQA